MKQRKNKKGVNLWFEKTDNTITTVPGLSTVFLMALLVILAWAINGPMFCFFDTWQLIINTGTTIVTFPLVFNNQQWRNKELRDIQIKRNERIAAEERAGNRLIMVDDLSEDELETPTKFYFRLSDLAKEQNDLHSSHPMAEVRDVHEYKKHLREIE